MKWQNYNYQYPWNLSGQKIPPRPVIDIELINGSITFPTTAIIDSGSDAIIASAEIAEVLNINPKDCRKELVGGILGNSVEAFTAKLKLKVDKFEDEIMNIEVTFVPDMQTGVLLGQEGFFQNFDILFEKRRNVFKLSAN